MTKTTGAATRRVPEPRLVGFESGAEQCRPSPLLLADGLAVAARLVEAQPLARHARFQPLVVLDVERVHVGAIDHERLDDGPELVALAHPTPHVGVLVEQQILVEEPHRVEDLAARHHARRLNTEAVQGLAPENPTARREVVEARPGQDPAPLLAVLIRVDDADLRVRGEVLELAAELAGQPQIVRVEEGDERAAGLTDAGVADTGDDAGMRQAQDPEGPAKGGEVGRRPIRGPVVHHEDLDAVLPLIENALQGLGDDHPPVVRGDHHAHDGHDWRRGAHLVSLTRLDLCS
ncbi:MAG TPA: hypothetical protein VML54_03865 [Candidatus Limnocylindrales bacterium]|nr:hypothetical protein [Candidatus Limnocylindrales bacterium]